MGSVTNQVPLGPSPARSSGVASQLSLARVLVLEALQAGDGGGTAAELARRLDLHPNTVREHLDALVDRGLAVRVPSPASGRGRPAWRYLPAPEREHDTRVRDYTGLATALAGHIARTSGDPIADALQAGRAWGQELLKTENDTRTRSALEARRRVVSLLDHLGFAPESDARTRSVALRRCPLLDAARRHTAVVCGVHLGLVQGVLEGMGVDPGRSELHPFSEPGACRLILAGNR